MTEHETRRTAEDLREWAKRMGFNPGSKFVSAEEFPSAEAFQKLCKGKSIAFWQDVMRQVRPKDEVLHIQKNLLLDRLRRGKSLEKDPIPGIGQQCIIASKLAAQDKEKKELLDSIHKRESCIKAKEKVLRKSGHKVIELENQVRELKEKQLMFKLKAADCRSKIEWFREISNVVSGLCPPPPNARPSVDTSSETAEAAIRKCVDAIREFQSNSSEIDLSLDDGSQSHEDHLKHLWENFRFNIAGWGAQQIWDAFNEILIPELIDEISALCADESSTTRSSDAHSSFIKDALSILPAKQTASILEFINLQTKAKIQDIELNKLKENLAETLNISKDNAYNTSTSNKSSINAPEIVKAWIEAQSVRAELSAKLQGIKAEIARLKESVPCQTVVSSSLKLVQEELAKLDLQVDNDKKQVERNLAHMKMVSVRIQAALSKAKTVRSEFNSQVPQFFKRTRNKSFDSDVDFASSEEKVPFTSTMIENDKLDPNFTLDSTCLSVVEKFGNLQPSDFVASLKESISKEAKLFIKVHLDLVPFVYRSGKKESMVNLMVLAPQMTSHSSNMPHRNFLQIVPRTPFTSAPQILLHQLYAQNHLRALNLYKLLHDRPSPTVLQAPKILEALEKQISKQEKALSEEIENANASAEKLALLMSRCQSNLEHWVERPVQEAVPSTLVVNGRTFRQWCQLYDEILMKQM
ncbi:AUGMIN subunit 5 [Frankliniella fusca]|uniref:AUGMIN subunit 5 n=1 Tax=Frankliniella fusca TaxID=407009 RepID=A0AAE1HFC8_9NEOP|nr:AUGMIN subunit 5 [Frankliniella fusca]